jgi:hypothetical protein
MPHRGREDVGFLRASDADGVCEVTFRDCSWTSKPDPEQEAEHDEEGEAADPE